MEKNDIRFIFDKFRKPLMDDAWSKEFFFSLIGNLWFYSSKNGEVFLFDLNERPNGVVESWDHITSLAKKLSDYRKDELYIARDYYSYVLEYFELILKSFGSTIDLSVTPQIQQSSGFSGFIVLSNNSENKSFLLSLSREKKLISIL
jgi:hypothetical protein